MGYDKNHSITYVGIVNFVFWYNLYKNSNLKK
jgi:hypothetical protein